MTAELLRHIDVKKAELRQKKAECYRKLGTKPHLSTQQTKEEMNWEKKLPKIGPSSQDASEAAMIRMFSKTENINTRISDLPGFGDGILTVKQFFEKFARYAGLNHWDEQEKALILPNCLHRRALTFYNTLSNKEMNHFNAAAPESLAKHCAFLYTEMQGKQDLDEFLEKLEISFEESNTPDETKVDILIRGLRLDLSYLLPTKMPCTYNDAVRYVQLRNAMKKHKDTQVEEILEISKTNLDTQRQPSTQSNRFNRFFTNEGIDSVGLLRRNRQLEQQLRQFRNQQPSYVPEVNYTTQKEHRRPNYQHQQSSQNSYQSRYCNE